MTGIVNDQAPVAPENPLLPENPRAGEVTVNANQEQLAISTLKTDGKIVNVPAGTVPMVAAPEFLPFGKVIRPLDAGERVKIPELRMVEYFEAARYSMHHGGHLTIQASDLLELLGGYRTEAYSTVEPDGPLARMDEVAEPPKGPIGPEPVGLKRKDVPADAQGWAAGTSKAETPVEPVNQGTV